MNGPSKIFLFIFLAFICTLFTSCEKENVSERENLSFNSDWRFDLNDSTSYSRLDFNDSNWRVLNVPHDWSIEGKFDENNPAGIGGGALPGGVGWYRKTFNLLAPDSSKRIYITFDGIYQNSEVYINGNLLGKRPNGYVSFQYDLTPYLNFDDQKNVLAVRVDNSDQPNSRWYSGSGIYRNVWLVKTHPIHINLWGTHITTPIVTAKSAEVNIAITINNTSSKNEELDVETIILDKKEKIIGRTQSKIRIDQKAISELEQNITVKNPELWSIENPTIYKAVSIIKLKNEMIDTYETSFGIRNFSFDTAKGFSLNGKPTKILGVCNHHDLGALGAAVNTRAIERQLEILKEMGCNGIRTSHNPPSPELLDLCDKMGFIVQNETFDMWAKKKVDNDYSKYWDEWHVKDLTDHLLRDRNHPSIFSWSIGNEIQEQWDSSGTQIAKELVSIVNKYAPNIPVTSGFNAPEPGNFIIQSDALDLIGFNYHHETFEQFPEVFKGQKFIATETVSSLHTRGEYDMPSDSVRTWPISWDIVFYDGNPGNTCSSYDNCSAPWGSTHAATWKVIKKHDFLSGMYIWTGFDYLGEPTPYQWPSRSSYFGIIDLAGFPKDIYYMYQSEWTDKPVLHLFPHWNWEEGENIDLWAYTNFEEVELFVNGKSEGVKSKQGDDLHIQWNVTYAQGSIKAVGKNSNGDTKEVIINTAGKAAKIKLEADRDLIEADGMDLSFITISVLDENGNIVPYADNLIHFKVPETVTIAGVDNGSQVSHESFKANKRKAFNGKCLLIIQSKSKKGKVMIEATSEGLTPALIELELK